jgi:NAD(P)-dependent dehydrogenase (short-subunit alcohol dehydrogenase family)
MTTLLREGLLSGRSIALGGSVSAAVREAALGLGATIGAADDDVGALVHDCGEAFAREGLTAALAETWTSVAAAANASLIPSQRGGKVVLIAPRVDAGEHTEAARDALENLARTLSVEWARYRITTTAITPGSQTSEGELATLVCYLLSEAGDYFSGCRFDLH